MVGHSGKHTHNECEEISDETALSETLEAVPN